MDITSIASEPIPIKSNNNSAGSSGGGSLGIGGGSPFDITGFIYSLSNWLRGIEEKEFNEEEYKEREQDLWRDWEWILSTTEEFLLKQNQSETQKVLGELDNLKRTASNLKIKPIFISRANELLKQLPEEDLETLRISLDSNKRLSIINSVIGSLEQTWLNYIQENYFKNEINSIHNINTNSPSLTPYSPLSDKVLQFPKIQQINISSSSNQNSLNTSSNSTSSISSNNMNENINNSIEEGWEEKDSMRSPLFPSTKPNLQQHENKSNLTLILSQDNNNINSSSSNNEKHQLNDSFGAISDMIVLNKNINKITWDQFLENFKGQKYIKGVNTRMKDIGWQASHGFNGSLNSRVMGDISWSIWNTLMTAIKAIREVTYEESIELTNQVNQLQPLLIQFWLATIRNSATGSKNEGVVVEKWKLEEIDKKKKIAQLKQSGTLDKYSPQRVRILSHEKKDLSSIRALLENKLKLKSKDR